MTANVKQRRRGRPSTGAREALIEAARTLFMERDFDRVSTADILARSGVSRGAMYHHFASKLELFRAVYEASEARLIGEIAADMAGAETPFEALLAGARSYLRHAETDEELRRIGLGQSRAVFGWEEWRRAASSLGLAAVGAVVTAAIEAGELPESDAETTAIVLLGVLIEASMPIIEADDRAAARRRSEAVVIALLEGLRR